MCGVVGVLSRKKNNCVNLDTAIKLLHHRGPDDNGIWEGDYIKLGHTRLAIIDLGHTGHQPMSYKNERYWITFNGEIYNYIELRKELSYKGHNFRSKSDTEVLLAAYAEWGPNCLDKLRGMFAFGIWDKAVKTLFLARDRLGEKPLYYYDKGDVFYFASELKALISILPNIPKFDPVNIDLYLHYQYVPEPGTPLIGINKLPAGYYLLAKCERWEIQSKCYWNLDSIEPVQGDPAKLIYEEFNNSIEMTLRSDVPVGVALSGGIDSGAIAVLASKKYRDKLHAFSVGYPGRPHYDEREQASELAKLLRLPYYEIELKTEELVSSFPDLVFSIDEPIADIAAFGHYSVMKLAADNGIKVMLSGIGGDELFWGYPSVLNAVRLSIKKQKILNSNSEIPVHFWKILNAITGNWLYQRIAQSWRVPNNLKSILQKIDLSNLSLDIANQIVLYDIEAGFKDIIKCRKDMYAPDFYDSIPDRNSYKPLEIDINICDNIPYEICKSVFDTWLISNCISLGDRVSMASSVEVRLPLLDYKLVEIVMGLRLVNADFELGEKYWLKSVLKGIMPDQILQRQKRGFQPPIQEWMEGTIKHYVNLLVTGYLVELNIISADFINRLINEFQSSRKHLFILYKLLFLEIWYRKIVIQE